MPQSAIGYAIDVSHHQPPASLPWQTKFAGSVDAVIVRANYGAELRDKHCQAHVLRARGIGAKVGLYMFYRPHHSVQKQLDLFRSQADAVALMQGDIVPCLDIEKDPFAPIDKSNPLDVQEAKNGKGQNVSTKWAGPVWELTQRLDEYFGALCMPYMTQREYKFLGSPTWVLDPKRPLWVAHFVNGAPATPGNRTCTMHQHRVAPYVAYGPGGYDKARPELDQNRIFEPLPLLGAAVEASHLLVSTSSDIDEDFDDYDDDRVAALTLTGEELGSMDFGLNIGGDAVSSGLREMSARDEDEEETDPGPKGKKIS